MVKRTCYILLLFSHVLLAFLLIYVNCIHPEYEGPVGMITAIVVIIIWLTVPIILLKSQDYGHWNRLDLCLKIFAFLPLIIVLIPIILICGMIMYVVGEINEKVATKEPFLKMGFTIAKEKKKNGRYLFFKKDSTVIKIKEYNTYEISFDSGNTFEDIRVSNFFSCDDRQELKDIFQRFESCDYRDRDDYAPTRFVIRILQKYFTAE